jgi:hypothetical protein
LYVEGMNCPSCGGKTKVLDSRESTPEATRRRRACKSCGERFTTYEIRLPTKFERVPWLEAIPRVEAMPREGEQATSERHEDWRGRGATDKPSER